MLDQLTQSGRSLVTLPGRLERALTRLESGQIEIRIADGPPDGRAGRRRTGRCSQAPPVPLGGASWALMVAAAPRRGVVLLLNQLLVPGWFCLGLAALIVLLLTLRR